MFNRRSEQGRLVRIVGFIVTTFLLTFAQTPNPEQLKQYLKQKGMSDAEIKNVSQSYQKKATAPVPTGLAPDQPDAAKIPPPDQSVSIYESILQNKQVDPDSLLRTLTVFGLDVFANAKSSTFATTDNMAAPADYIIGSGDEINVLLWGRMNEDYRLKVDRDGKINIPHIGPIGVAGLPFNALQKNILDRVQNIEGVQASVSMGDLHSIGVYIVGDVKSPGYYTVSGLSNITNALFAAGGPSRRGSLRNIQLKRNGSVIAVVDFYDFLLSGKDNSSIKLKSGDVIQVPIVKRMAAVAGNVRRSALYEIKPNTSLKDLLVLAGGITPAAWTNRIQVERYKENQFQIVLDFTSQNSTTLPDVEIQDGDVVKVFPVVEKDKNAVYLTGNVKRPGKYEFKENMHLSDVLTDYNELKPESYFNYAIILRQEPPNFLNRIIPVNLKNAMENHASSDNIVLQARDEIVIYSRDFFEPERTVFIDGAVTNSGTQKLLENMKVRDLIIKAGGLLDEASLDRGELYRRVYNGDSVTTEKMDICVSCALADDPKHNIELKRFDRVYIRNKKGWEPERRVQLRGEFTFSGEYVLMERETLGHLIERAGGFTKEAYLPSALLIRSTVKALEQKRNDDYINRLQADAVMMTTTLASKGQDAAQAQQLLEQQMLLINKLHDQQSDGRVVIDLTKEELYRDFILEDGDVILVPKKSGTVSVIGEVYNPATFRFEETHAKAKYYIDMAGGYKENASKKNIYILKANGSIVTNQTINVEGTELQPGDFVVVPQKIEYSNNAKAFMDMVQAIFQIGSTLSVIIALIVAVNAMKK